MLRCNMIQFPVAVSSLSRLGSRRDLRVPIIHS